MKKTTTLLLLLCLPILVKAQCWQFITAGDAHTLAIKNDGTLWAWGSNSNGQLGDGTLENRNVPTQVGTDTDWVVAAAGSNFSYAIKQNGTMYAWGGNNRGQLSDGTNNPRTLPAQVGTANDWQKVKCNFEYVVAQKTNGTFWSCGLNQSVQLGLGFPSTQVTQLTQNNITGNFESYDLGYRHTVLLKDDGILWGWGEGVSGKLATGSSAGSNIPFQPNTINHWSQITASYNGTLFKKTDGTIWGVGQNQLGMLGFGNYQINNFVIQQIGTDNDWRSIEASKYCSMIVKNNGTLWSCGYNITGALGNGTTTNTNLLGQVGTATHWDKVRCGLFYTVALTENGTLMAWGDNSVGQLGDGTFTNSLVPKQIGDACNLSSLDLQKLQVVTYPNPVQDVVNVTVQNSASEPIKVKIFNLLGHTVLSKEITTNEIHNNAFTLDCSQLKSGMYLLQVSSGGKFVNQKIIKN